LSAVIVTHNSVGVIGGCLKSVRSLLPRAEIIVVDNASEDATVDACTLVGQVRVLRNEANLGFGRACNQGVAAARGSHVLLLNPDAQLVEVDAVRLYGEFSRTPFGLVGPLFWDGKRKSPRLFPDRRWQREVLTHSFGPLRPRELPTLRKLRLRPRSWWPAGAALLAARRELTEVGGFRPEFFLYSEDRDLARRYRAAGLPVETTRSIVAQHSAGRSSATDDPLRTVAAGWAYIGWIEYLSIWQGRNTARCAAAWVDRLQAQTDRALGLVEARHWVPSRVRRKRTQLRGIEAFVSWQSSSGAGTAEPGFCPTARQIIAERRS
jgi:GT2 family glycosyltransferase